jgi:anti-sigma B factor antagonist
MESEFRIDDRRASDGTPVVAVAGEVDLFTAPEFKQRVMAPIVAGAERLIVDLSETTFIDSSSLGVMIGAHRRVEARGHALVVVCPNDDIATTFRITGLDSVFELVPSLAAAVEGGGEAAAA